MAATDELAVLLARDLRLGADISNPVEVAELLRAFKAVEAEGQIVSLLARNPAGNIKLDNLFGVISCLEALKKCGADDQVRKLSVRAAADAPLGEAHNVGLLLDFLSRVGMADQVAVLLARDPARQVVVNLHRSADSLLPTLHELGAGEQVTALADRIVANAPFGQPDTIARLSEALLAVDADGHAEELERRLKATYLSDEEWDPADPVIPRASDEAGDVIPVDRLPAAGHFDRFLEADDHATRFRFGREPDGTPAEPWTWDDLV
ncbi:hypothetical protein [Amycolatopsis sp. NPDC051102]|uniref:hypothetical protein n=1 Tax=Amycolatopsis sp. NPDC051102 TaxID=3155163 RepID=UPI003427F47B